MVSILYFFSNERLALFKNTIQLMETVTLYDKCEKIVCSDGPANFKLEGYKVLEIKRLRQDYNWAAIWNAGVEASSNDILWYLDCDRFVPQNYLVEALKLLKDKQWVYPRDTLRVRQAVNLNTLRRIQLGGLSNMTHPEPRVNNPPSESISQPGKNPFSGNSLFTKKGYLESGGLNKAFDGYGYADIDYYMKMHKAGYKFVHPTLDEYHQWHPHAVVNYRSKQMMYYNGLMYCKNWGLQPHLMLSQNSAIHNITTKAVKANQPFYMYEKKSKLLLL